MLFNDKDDIIDKEDTIDTDKNLCGYTQSSLHSDAKHSNTNDETQESSKTDSEISSTDNYNSADNYNSDLTNKLLYENKSKSSLNCPHQKNVKVNLNKNLRIPVLPRNKFSTINSRNNTNEEIKKLEKQKIILPSEIKQTECGKIKMSDLRSKSILEMQKIASILQIESCSSQSKQGLIYLIVKQLLENDFQVIGDGVVEILSGGFAFLRSVTLNYLSGSDDIYISPNQVRKFGLKMGDEVSGEIKLPKRNEKYFAIVKIDKINDRAIEDIKYRTSFDDLVPWYPEDKLLLDYSSIYNGKNDYSTRIIDIVSPLGKGQRALIVAPPKSGKTVLMQNIANVITKNHPEVKLMVLLIDERPEEVTDMMRFVRGEDFVNGEVISSTFDEPASRHVQLAEIVIERAKRLVENNKDVVILLDSITRLARAYNTVAPSSGKVLTGGIDSNALHRPKRFFGAARNIEGKGSITIIATALIDTGSRMDDVIFEEFKGTGNCEIILDRRIADKRIFPSIDVAKSGTRKEEMLYDKEYLQKIWILRRILGQMSSNEAMEFLLEKLKNTNKNSDFFENMNT